MEASVGKVCHDVNVGVRHACACRCYARECAVRTCAPAAVGTMQAVSGATSPHPLTQRVVTASSMRSEAGETTSAQTGRGTQVLRTLVRGSAVTLVVSIAADLFSTTLFALHPIFISAGFLGFMSEGVLLAHSFRLVDGPDRVKAIWRHALTQLAACVSIAVGFGAIYLNKVFRFPCHAASSIECVFETDCPTWLGGFHVAQLEQHASLLKPLNLSIIY